jgi:hypothetical protein
MALNTYAIEDLLRTLIHLIDDDCRATEEDTEPSLQVTIATTDGKSWDYQTGDTSYSGACYGHPHWSVVYLYRDSDCKALAQTVADELESLVSDD